MEREYFARGCGGNDRSSREGCEAGGGKCLAHLFFGNHCFEEFFE